MPDEIPDSLIVHMIDDYEDRHADLSADPGEDSLRGYFAGRLHRDWPLPWWRRTEWRQVIAAAVVGVVLAVLFTVVFVAAGV